MGIAAKRMNKKRETVFSVGMNTMIFNVIEPLYAVTVVSLTLNWQKDVSIIS